MTIPKLHLTGKSGQSLLGRGDDLEDRRSVDDEQKESQHDGANSETTLRFFPVRFRDHASLLDVLVEPVIIYYDNSINGNMNFG